MLKPRIALPAARSTHTRDLPVMTISSINFRTTDEHIFLRWEIIYSVYFALTSRINCSAFGHHTATLKQREKIKQNRLEAQRLQHR